METYKVELILKELERLTGEKVVVLPRLDSPNLHVALTRVRPGVEIDLKFLLCQAFMADPGSLESQFGSMAWLAHAIFTADCWHTGKPTDRVPPIRKPDVLSECGKSMMEFVAHDLIQQRTEVMAKQTKQQHFVERYGGGALPLNFYEEGRR